MAETEPTEPTEPNPDDTAPPSAHPAQLRCTMCGYPLDGLTIQKAFVTCPECGFAQRLLACSSEPSRRLSGVKTAGLMVLLLVVGGPMTALVLIYLIVLVRVFFG